MAKEKKAIVTGTIAERYLKITTNPYSYLLNDETQIGIREYIDTGNYALNALISGDPYKGIPSGRIVQFAGPESTGKTFFSIECIKQAQKVGYTVLYYDTEWGENKENLVKNRGVDPDLFIHAPIANIPDLKTDILKVLDTLTKKEKLMIVIDSIGNLVTTKEQTDSAAGVQTKDMTRAGDLKSLFRTITLPLGGKHVPMIIINHVYEKIGSFFGGTEIAGGGGSKYLSSTIISLSKAQAKEGETLVGALITAKSLKNRMAKEKEKVKLVINYSTGYSRVTGLFDLALESGHIKMPKSGYYTITGGDGKQLRKGDFVKRPEMWDDILKNGFADWICSKFKYQSGVVDGEVHRDMVTLEGTLDAEDELLELQLMNANETETLGEEL